MQPLDMAVNGLGTIAAGMVTYAGIRRLGTKRKASLLVGLYGLLVAGSLWWGAILHPEWNPIMALVNIGVLILSHIIFSAVASRSQLLVTLVAMAFFLALTVFRFFLLRGLFPNDCHSFMVFGFLMATVGRSEPGKTHSGSSDEQMNTSESGA